MAKLAYNTAVEGREHLIIGGTTTGSIGSGSGGPTTKLNEQKNNWLLPAIIIAYFLVK